jgi:hypothetical protein
MSFKRLEVISSIDRLPLCMKKCLCLENLGSFSVPVTKILATNNFPQMYTITMHLKSSTTALQCTNSNLAPRRVSNPRSSRLELEAMTTMLRRKGVAKMIFILIYFLITRIYLGGTVTCL